MTRSKGLTLGLILLVLAAIGCSSGDMDEKAPANAQQLTVTFGDSLAFDPVVLSVEAGRPVVLTVKNVGASDHDFTITGLPARDVKNAIKGGHGHGGAGAIVGHPKPGGEVTIRFTPTKSGTYEFYCSVAGHKDAGMKGAITVA